MRLFKQFCSKKIKILLCLVFLTVSTNATTLKDSVWNLIKHSDIRFKKVVLGQAILESGHFHSKFYKKTNNLFGMRFPKNRHTLAIGKNKKGYAIYKNWEDSIKDFSIFQKNLKSRNQKEYFIYLEKDYAFLGYDKELKEVIRKI